VRRKCGKQNYPHNQAGKTRQIEPPKSLSREGDEKGDSGVLANVSTDSIEGIAKWSKRSKYDQLVAEKKN
jgi:hypothetical protein